MLINLKNIFLKYLKQMLSNTNPYRSFLSPPEFAGMYIYLFVSSLPRPIKKYTVSAKKM